MSEITLRHEVQWFAEQMELKLRENGHESGVAGENPSYLLERIREEATELEGTLIYGPVKYDRQSVISDATDIAYFAMIMATNAENDSLQFS